MTVGVLDDGKSDGGTVVGALVHRRCGHNPVILFDRSHTSHEAHTPSILQYEYEGHGA